MSPTHSEDALRCVSGNLDKFAWQFYKQLAKDEKENFICSPISVSMVLSMAAFGARGNTEKQIRTALSMSDNDELNKSGFQSLIDILNATKKIDLRLANKIFVDETFQILPEFLSLTETTFRSTSENINFRKIIEASEIINNWCAKNTNDRIKNIIKPDDLQAAPALVMVNAVYFKGSWAKKFDKDSTTMKPFFIDEKTFKDVPMMHKKSKYNFGKIDSINSDYIELPYESDGSDNEISMFVILPKETKNLAEVESNLHQVNFKQLHSDYGSKQVTLELPKFKIESQFDLGNILQHMGMTDMFSGAADFRAISGSPELSVSRVIQKAFIEVNEEGSEAAAVTAMMMLRCSMPMHQEFIVNRPFICSIVATNTGLQLFNARVVDPIAE